MKPFEYMLIPPAEHTNEYGLCFDIYECPACLEEMGGVVRSKHLTDAECAAEYWRAELDERDPFDSFGRVMFGTKTKADTWYRFATTPHAFGGDS